MGDCACQATQPTGFNCACAPHPEKNCHGPHGPHGPQGPQGPHCRPPRPQPPPFPIPTTDDEWILVSDIVFGPIADISIVKSNVVNDSTSFEMVQFLAALPGACHEPHHNCGHHGRHGHDGHGEHGETISSSDTAAVKVDHDDPDDNGGGDNGGDNGFWGFNGLPTASIFSYNKASSWQNAQNTNNTGNNQEFDVRTIFAEVIQFADDNSDGKYTPSDDTILLKCRLNEADFGMGFSQNTFHPSDNVNVTGVKITATGTLGRNVYPPWFPPSKPQPPGQRKCSGTVTLEYLLTTGADYLDGLYLTPESSKMSVGIDDFVYKSLPINSTASKTLLALKMFVVTETSDTSWEYSSGSSDGRFPKIASRTKTKEHSGGFFSWNGTYAGDGKYHSVTSDMEIVTDSGGEFIIEKNQMVAQLLFTFSGGEHAHIYWDPTTGYGNVALSDNTAVVVGGVVGGVAVVAAIAAVAMLLQKRKSAGMTASDNSLFSGTQTHGGYGSV
jgi:hypothetical protein